VKPRALTVTVGSRLVLATTTALAIAAVSSLNATSASNNEQLRRPLHFPHVSPDARCPVSPTRPIPDQPGELVGGARVFLKQVGGATGGTIDVTQSLPDTRGWLGQKTPWLIRRPYNGPLLLRGARLDRPGPVRFALSYGQHLGALRLPTPGEAAAAGYTGVPSSSLFRSGGCYGFQLDGLTFSDIVVVRVVR
jgi:hypothetical protein